jgi:hypothetical protein
VLSCSVLVIIREFIYRWAGYLITKIITLLEFFNFVSEVSRLQYEWSSDCWCFWKSFEGKCVSSMKKCIFISLEKCFCTGFCEFFEVILDCTCALANQSQYAGIVYEHYCLCPGWPCARKCWAVTLAMYVTNCIYSYTHGFPRLVI